MKENSNQVLKELLKNKEEGIYLLKNILKLPITDIEFIGIEHFETIEEYKFSLLKIKLKYNSNEKREIYLKFIKGGKIKESIFCFWSFLYEDYLKNNIENDVGVLEKTFITQTNSDDYCSKIVLTLSKKINYCAEIDLIELKKFATENCKIERWVKNLEIKSEDILFIGIKR